MGDWNTELTHLQNPGSKVLRNFSKKSQFWLKSPIAHTNESPSYSPKRLKLQLDYISYSNDLISNHSGIYSPSEQREEFGCEKEKKSPEVKSYFNKELSKKCYARFSKDYIELKEASDHFPIWANLNLAN